MYESIKRTMPSSLSVYILTMNSERRIAQVLKAAKMVADEIVVIDSGSTDKTIEILTKNNIEAINREFDNFRDQRIFAENNCTNKWILALDSDEVLSEQLIEKIKHIKANDFYSDSVPPPDGFRIKRDWYFLGDKITNFYPTRTPEHIVRLFKRNIISMRESRIIHETLQTSNHTIHTIEEAIEHYTCDSIDDLYGKIGLYTRLLAEDMHSRGERSSWAKINIYPWVLWVRWYLINKSWKDGERGLILSRYARTTIYLKYLKLKYYSSDDNINPAIK